MTSDLDALQLVGPLTKVYAIKNGLSNIEEFDIPYFEQKYGITVGQFLDLKSLKGDSSDNLPGVPGVGEKTAISLLQDYKTLDGVYEHLTDIKPTIAKKLEAGKELAYMSKEVGRIWTDAPVTLDWEKASIEDIDLQRVADILERLQFSSLVRRLPKHMQMTPTQTVEHEPVFDGLKEVAWPETLSIDGPVLVHIDDDELWISTNGTTCMHQPLASVDRSVWSALALGTFIAYDVKALYHACAAHDAFPRFDTIHDIRQAAFLIDPLARDRSLEAITHNAPDPASVLGALWSLYQSHCASFEQQPKLQKIAHEFDFPLVYLLFRMEHRGVLISPETLATMSAELDAAFKKREQEMYTLAGKEFNVGSPAQLSDVLFNTLGLPTTGIKKGKTGYSTGQAELDKLRGQHPIIELIEQTRELAKLKNTYTDALPKLVDKQNRLHTTFNQDVAATGRLSSTQPNLQNIPIRTELGRKIRDAFVAEPGNVLVSADYSQFELRLAAILAGDSQLIEDFNGDVDIHTKTASEVYGIPMEEVTKDQRRAAKVINFGVLYGMSPHGLSANTGMSFTQAKEFIDRYFAVRAPIRAFINDTLDKARSNGYVETYYGRRRPTPDIHSSNFMVRSGAERAAANMPIQGTEADLMKRAMLQVEEKLDGLGEQILQIHDSILIECPKENAEKVAVLLKETMESVAPELAIHLKVDVSTGTSWGELG